MTVTEKFHIVLFDGVCNLCNNSVDFIIRRDTKNVFKVGAIQDAHTQKLLDSYEIPADYLDSLIYIHKDQVYFKSRGALEIARNLGGLWPILYGLIIIPAFIRDPIYDWIARNRYRWFGKKETCRLPTPEERAKFLTAEDLEQ
ncbi:thiol-disulfide oxidoreductase DCC family protein [Mongoliitalea lutea]|uniref:Thiol-disulfide oxidoreductase n=1 Tax=Mongoliitalea lutea TaxID=849756 RepID=A0A8J3G582_9BACT|nr:thiol-disulfide oxidoreductase DCC family protein [Mongoliitalea lutea]GHB35205.1 thiol-disulfide oxidoreductase [Mongoliitalea lutea]